jgi:endonuclease YncB( thermonuclease family)
VFRAARRALAIALLAACPPAAAGRAQGTPARGPARGEVVLDGLRARVTWTDGDTFRIRSGPRKGRTARLAGLNALEGYGPVHLFGGWDPEDLHAIATSSAALAAGVVPDCATGPDDRYGRVLASCPAVAAALIHAGHAVVFAVDGPADAALLALQRQAVERGAGMWARGAPAELLTSLHSADETGLGGRGYDRVADTRTGAARTLPHERVYATCQRVCHGEGPDRSCMVYVPHELRYRNRPWCLRPGRSPSPRPSPPRVRGRGELDSTAAPDPTTATIIPSPPPSGGQG